MGAPDVGVELLVKLIQQRILGSILEYSVARIVHNDINFAVRESLKSRLDQILPKGSRAGVGLKGDNFDPQVLEIGNNLIRGGLIRVVSE